MRIQSRNLMKIADRLNSSHFKRTHVRRESGRQCNVWIKKATENTIQKAQKYIKHDVNFFKDEIIAFEQLRTKVLREKKIAWKARMGAGQRLLNIIKSIRRLTKEGYEKSAIDSVVKNKLYLLDKYLDDYYAYERNKKKKHL